MTATPQNPYAFVKIPVMLCWNDDNGNFDNQIYKIDIHDSIQLDSHYIDEESCEAVGLAQTKIPIQSSLTHASFPILIIARG